MFNYDYELEKHYHPENFEVSDEEDEDDAPEPLIELGGEGN